LFRRSTTQRHNGQSDYAIVCEVRGAQCRISLSGRISTDSAPDLRNLLLERLKSSACQSLTVEFQEVTYIDTSGLAILVELLKASHNRGKTFRLSGLRERPRYLLQATGLLPLFDGATP
jgi:anti-sigma B factor antagonist